MGQGQAQVARRARQFADLKLSFQPIPLEELAICIHSDSAFERNDEAQQCDVNGCFPGQGKGYQVPNRPDINWARQQELNAIMEELKKEPKFQSTGKPGNWSPKWQDGMNAPGL